MNGTEEAAENIAYRHGGYVQAWPSFCARWKVPKWGNASILTTPLKSSLKISDIYTDWASAEFLASSYDFAPSDYMTQSQNCPRFSQYATEELLMRRWLLTSWVAPAPLVVVASVSLACQESWPSKLRYKNSKARWDPKWHSYRVLFEGRDMGDYWNEVRERFFVPNASGAYPYVLIHSSFPYMLDSAMCIVALMDQPREFVDHVILAGIDGGNLHVKLRNTVERPGTGTPLFITMPQVCYVPLASRPNSYAALLVICAGRVPPMLFETQRRYKCLDC